MVDAPGRGGGAGRAQGGEGEGERHRRACSNYAAGRIMVTLWQTIAGNIVSGAGETRDAESGRPDHT